MNEDTENPKMKELIVVQGVLAAKKIHLPEKLVIKKVNRQLIPLLNRMEMKQV
jgi:hypothetical protein